MTAKHLLFVNSIEDDYMINLKTIIIISSLMLSSCGEDHNISNKSIVIGPSVDDLIIAPTKNILQFGQGIEKLVYINNEPYLLRTSSFDSLANLININDYTVKDVTLPKSGPMAIRRIQAIEYINDDSIFIFADQRLILMDILGDIKAAVLYYPSNERLSIPEGKRIRVNRNNDFSFYNGCIYVPIVSDDYQLRETEQGSILGKINLESFEVELMDVNYPNLEDDFYGSLHSANYTFVENLLIYNFSFSPNIYTYDLSTNKKETFKVSFYNGIVNEPYVGSPEPQDQMEYATNSIEYRKIYYSKNSDRLIQFCLVPSLDNYGKSRRTAVRVFDKDFKLIAETILPIFYDASGLVIEDKMYVKYLGEEVMENTIHYKELTLN